MNQWLSPHFQSIAQLVSQSTAQGSLADAMKGSDVLIGVSASGIVTEEMVASMAENSVVFSMANPVPEIMPDLALAAGARIVGTGRSDYPNQINNVLAFPGIFRGALDIRAKRITNRMKMAAVFALAQSIPPEELNENHILPSPFNERLVANVADAVAKAWRDEEHL